MESPPIHILGAGLTGLSAGYHLQDDFEIHERRSHAGGLVVTHAENGYRFDVTGHLLHLRTPEMAALVHDLLGDTLNVVERRSRVFSCGVYTRYPYQSNTYGLPPEVAFECIMGYLKTRERQVPVEDLKTFEQFCHAYFGEGFSKHFMIPYNTKLWGVHPRDITAEWCSRFVPLPRLEDVIAGAVGMHSRELGYNVRFHYPRDGIGVLPKALSARLQHHIHYNCAPVGINWRDRKIIFQDREVSYDVLISTAPLDTLVRLLQDPPEAVRSAGARLRCNPLWYLDVALTVPCGQDFHWAYVPEEKYPFYRVGCYSHFSADMAPEGKACLYVELASREQPVMSSLMPQLVQGLIDMQIIQRERDIAFVRPRHIDHAYVLFDHNCYDALRHIRPFLAEHHILSCGRYGSWDYSSMEDALLGGRNAAAKARELL